MGLLQKTASPNVAKPLGSVPTHPLNRQPTVADIPQGDVSAETAESVAEEVENREAKVFVNDFTDETKEAIRKHVSAKTEEALASAELTTMQMCHLCFVSPTSIKSRGKTTDSAKEVIEGQYAGTKREGVRGTRDAQNIAGYVLGLNTPEKQAEFLKIMANPIEYAKLLKSLAVKPS